MLLTITRAIWNSSFWIVLVCVIAFSILNALSERPDSKLPFRTFIVQSGSMEPTIMTGDLIFIRRNTGFGIKDVITYRDPTQHTVTHRIVKTQLQPNGSLDFVTKGDNNEDEDQYTTQLSSVLGVHWFTIPKIGYGLVYLRSFMGIVVMISLFAGWIISDLVWQELNQQAKKAISENRGA
ncbi:MAG: signal peptidase I [Candidatus Pacebacteria bacterium RIFCSPHIGHO2_01_FULL_46_16]|nr:MAG: signal peptidase I [Candidatus Pacebacteria bacterium RIFCSPHIGHO2_01_FULL_46_16]OGJ38203.1 MAG: signal peptidase I [Candidatus Pacebacteria bacterium RIFCSPLOWO2_01_FULL_47_12]